MKSLKKVRYSWWLKFMLLFKAPTVAIDTETTSLIGPPVTYYVITKQLFGTTYVIEAGTIDVNLDNIYGKEISV